MKKTISVFFSGTGFSLDSPEFLAASLYSEAKEDNQHIKIGFDGCGVQYGLRGVVFGTGIDDQCNQAIQRILQEIQAGNEITLNIYGHSRGAVSALMLAQQLSSIDPQLLSINMALLDPVPGNFITTSTLDPFNISLANKTMDLTDCKPLKKVLALYPHIPLPAIACHAPLFVSYPEGIELEEEVIGGCHAQAEHLKHPASTIAKWRIEEFLTDNGTLLASSRDYSDKERLKADYLKQYQLELEALKKLGPMSRDAHSAKGVYISTKPNATYFNDHHRKLAGGAGDGSIALTIQPSYGPVSLFKRFTAAYPLAWQILKWSFLSIGLAGLLYFTGGLASIPLGAIAMAQLGIFTPLVVGPVFGGVLAALWYGIMKPGLLWATQLFYYPKYSIRGLPKVVPGLAEDTTTKVLDVLGSDRVSNQPQQDRAPYQGDTLFKSQHQKKESLEPETSLVLDM